MIEWLADYRPDLPAGFLFGSICSIIGRFWRRFIVSAGLFLVTYKVAVDAAAHAGFRWNNEVAARATMGVLLGCLVRPAGAMLVRSIRARSAD